MPTTDPAASDILPSVRAFLAAGYSYDAIRFLAEQLVKLDERTSMLTSAVARPTVGEIAARLATIADEQCGPLPVQTADQNLTTIEAGFFQMRQEVVRVAKERDEASDRILGLERADEEQRNWKAENARLIGIATHNLQVMGEVVAQRDDLRARLATADADLGAVAGSLGVESTRGAILRTIERVREDIKRKDREYAGAIRRATEAEATSADLAAKVERLEHANRVLDREVLDRGAEIDALKAAPPIPGPDRAVIAAADLLRLVARTGLAQGGEQSPNAMECIDMACRLSALASLPAAPAPALLTVEALAPTIAPAIGATLGWKITGAQDPIDVAKHILSHLPPVAIPPLVAPVSDEEIAERLHDRFMSAAGSLVAIPWRDRGDVLRVAWVEGIKAIRPLLAHPIPASPVPGRTVTVDEIVGEWHRAGYDDRPASLDAILTTFIGSTITASATPPTKEPPPKVEPGVPVGDVVEDAKRLLAAIINARGLAQGGEQSPNAVECYDMIQRLGHARLQGPATPRAEEGRVDRETLIDDMMAAANAAPLPVDTRTVWQRAADVAIARLALSSPGVEGPVWTWSAECGGDEATVGRLTLLARKLTDGPHWAVFFGNRHIHGEYVADLATAKRAAVAFALELNGATLRGPAVDVAAIRACVERYANDDDYMADDMNRDVLAVLDGATPARPAPVDPATAFVEAVLASPVPSGSEIENERERLRDAVVEAALGIRALLHALSGGRESWAPALQPLVTHVRAYNAHLTGAAPGPADRHALDEQSLIARRCPRCYPGKPGRELIDCDGSAGFRDCTGCVAKPTPAATGERFVVVELRDMRGRPCERYIERANAEARAGFLNRGEATFESEGPNNGSAWQYAVVDTRPVAEHRLTDLFVIRPTEFGNYDIALPESGDIEGFGIGTLADVAELGRALTVFAGGVTVGAALAMPQVQDGSHVAEWSGLAGSRQYAIRDGLRTRIRSLDDGATWGPWRRTYLSWDEFPPLCRLVPVDLADADPATRGPT